jgi:hypothetical protein
MDIGKKLPSKTTLSIAPLVQGAIESVVFLWLPRQLEAEDGSEQRRKQKN